MRTLGNQPGSTEPKRRLARRPSSSTLVSVAVHVVLGLVAWQAIQVPAVFDRFLRVDREARPVRERVEFVTVTPSAAVESTSVARPARRATSPTPAATSPAPATVPLVAPTEVPRELPPPSTGAELPVGTGLPGVVGPLRGGTGSVRGVQPNYDDPRVWAGDPEFFYAPKTQQERLDSALYASLARHMDSVAANAYTPNKFERGDWTFGKEGSKWGVDQQFIRLGRLSIPTALLALLPLNQMQGNPIAMERARNAAYMRNDILFHAQAAMNEEQFRKAVKQIRDRKERERRQAQRTSPTSPGPIASPGERPPPQ